MYRLALAASLDGSQEGAELAKEYKRNYVQYSILSARYLALVKELAKMRLHPDEVESKYAALDEAFDKLQDESIIPLDKELKAYFQKRFNENGGAPIVVRG